MNKTYFATTTAAFASVFPIVQTDAATIKCTYDGSYTETMTCTRPNGAGDVTLHNNEAVYCICSDPRTKKYVFCQTGNPNIDDDGDGHLDDYVRFSEGPCNYPTCEAGKFLNTDNYYCRDCATYTCNENATSDAGALGVNECYVPKTAVQSDKTGTFEFTNNCYYTGEMCIKDLEEESTTTTAA